MAGMAIPTATPNRVLSLMPVFTTDISVADEGHDVEPDAATCSTTVSVAPAETVGTKVCTMIDPEIDVVWTWTIVVGAIVDKMVAPDREVVSTTVAPDRESVSTMVAPDSEDISTTVTGTELVSTTVVSTVWTEVTVTVGARLDC